MASQLRKNFETNLFEVRDLDGGELLFSHPDYWTAECWMYEREERVVDAMIEAGEIDAESLGELDAESAERIERENLIDDLADAIDPSDLAELGTDELRAMAQRLAA